MPGPIKDEMSGAVDGTASSAEVATYEPFTIVEQRVQLDLDFRERQVQGTTTLKIFKTDSNLEYVTLDARQCEIDQDGITVNNKNARSEYKDPYHHLDTPRGYIWGAGQHHLRRDRMKPLQPARRSELPMTGREQKGCQPAHGSLRIWLRTEKPKIKIKSGSDTNTYEVTIPFRITHLRDGLHFVGVDDGDTRYPHAFTRHSVEPGFASSLFPCVDDRTRVEEWNICLKFPRSVGDALKQPLASSHTVPPTSGVKVSGVSAAKKTQQNRRDVAMVEEDKLLDMTAVCSGTLVGEHADTEDATKKVMEFQARYCGAQHIGFAIGPFEDVDLYSAYRSEEDEAKLGGNAVKVHGYCLPGRGAEVRNTCHPLANATDFFTLNFSKYPYDENSYKICFVDDMVEDTVPLQAFSLCSSRLLFPEEIIDTEIDVVRKLVHSLASQYFGIFINPNELTDTWIVVGLAYYMTDLYLKRLCGNNYYRYQMRTLAEKLTEVDHGRPSLHELGRILRLGDFEMDFMALKAPLVIFILDRRLLKSSNSSGVTRVISQRLRDAMQAPDSFAANFVLSSDQFRRQCEKKGRLRLEDFWDQWVLSSGCPRFNVTQRFNKKRLEVEVTVIQNQVKWAQESHQLEKTDFWRDIVEERHHVEASEVPLTFTGPMTFRVHEADGTPYEHCLEIKLDAAATKGSRLSMPYNTKYKRIKRVRQKKKDKGRDKAAVRDPDRMDDDGNEEDEDKNHTLNTFGDVLIDDDEMASWKLVDWDDDQQAAMDQESYEWIRVDCDFEWIYNLETNFKVYMTVAQLQQDRDVAGQVESMLTLTRNQPSNIQTTMLLRTLYDARYFYGIRTMAANALTGHAEPANNFRGMHHLMRVFKTFFCFPGTSTPRPNDFSNKKEYYIQMAIPMALARIRGGREFCPEEARQLILDQLIYNNNDENPFSDQFYVASLLEALATSLIRMPARDQIQRELDQKMRAFLDEALEQIERYMKMDEWVCSYNNLWTVTGLDCKMKLMKCGVIPISGVDFAQYLNPQTDDLIQIKAFECLIELGYLLRASTMKLLLVEISTHRSPFVRDQLFKAFTRGLAAIAFGELEVPGPLGQSPKALEPRKDADGDHSMLEEEEDDGGLIVEQSEDVIKRKQKMIARRQDITSALKELREVVQDDENLQREIWKAIDSSIIGLVEKTNLLELCATLFPEEYEMLVTMKYPQRWKVERGACRPGRSLVMSFSSSYKTAPEKKRKLDEAFPVEVPSVSTSAPVATPAPAPAPAPVAVAAPVAAAAPVVPESEKSKPEKSEKPKNKIKISRGNTFSSKTAEPSPALSPAPASRQPSVAAVPSKSSEIDRRDSIAVQNKPKPVVNLTSAVSSGPKSPAPEPPRPIANGKVVKPSKKRKLADTEGHVASSRPSKRKMITMKYNKAKLNDKQRSILARIPSSKKGGPPADSIVATSIARGTGSNSSPSRVDVPNASFTSTLSAGSSSYPSASQQKTPLPNGKIRKPLPNGEIRRPLPSGSGGSAGSSPNRPPAGPRSVSHSTNKPSASPRPISPVASRSSMEPGPKRKIVKLKVSREKAASIISGSSARSSPVAAPRPAPGK